MGKMHDKQMPKGWHTIKSALIAEIATAANFALCMDAADALLHARLIGESIAREAQNGKESGQVARGRHLDVAPEAPRGVPESAGGRP